MPEPQRLRILLVGASGVLGRAIVAELSPRPRDHASDFLAAKLIYKTLGYIFCQA